MTVPTPEAPYGVDPMGRPYSDKSKIVAGILQLFLGYLGIGRFYVGSVGAWASPSSSPAVASASGR
ncbi:hypothetical protein RKD18_005127 [Streptomyces phaeoluteigriseus]